jgi:hypothetical protein
MKITVDWDNVERTAVRMNFEARWDWSDYGTAQKICNALIQSVSHTVDVIADIHCSPHAPHDVIVYYRNYTRTRPENTGQIILVGASTFVRSLVQTLLQLLPNAGTRFAFADSLEDARRLSAQGRRRVTL